jgi:hypothetical protein
MAKHEAKPLKPRDIQEEIQAPINSSVGAIGQGFQTARESAGSPWGLPPRAPTDPCLPN